MSYRTKPSSCILIQCEIELWNGISLDRGFVSPKISEVAIFFSLMLLTMLMMHRKI